MEQENTQEKDLDRVIVNSISSMRFFKMTSLDKEITDKQEALIFKLLQQEDIYLLDEQNVVDQMKDKKLNRREASAIIAFLWGIVAFRSTFKKSGTVIFGLDKSKLKEGWEK